MSRTEQDWVDLRKALEAARAVAAGARSADFGLKFQCNVLQESPEEALSELRALQMAIENFAELAIFKDTEQSGIWTNTRVTSSFLVYWMVSRAQTEGSYQTIDDLQRYLRSETLTLEESLLIDGFDLAATMDVGKFCLSRWRDWPLTDTKWYVTARCWPSNLPSAVISCRHQVPRRHFSPWDHRPTKTPSIEPLRDVLRCLTFVTRAAYRLRQHVVLAPAWAP